jgi:hypothetical protein
MIDKNLKLEIGPVSPINLTYDEAVLYCFSLEIDGKIGWRIPTYAEFNDFRCYLSGVTPGNHCCWYKDEHVGESIKRRVYPIRNIL